MDVNITLILQILQFGCAYYFLRTFLFVPACLILDTKEAEKQLLYTTLEREQQTKDLLQLEYQDKNSKFKEALVQAVPAESVESVYQQSHFDAERHEIEEIALSTEDRKKTEAFLVDHLSRVIKK